MMEFFRNVMRQILRNSGGNGIGCREFRGMAARHLHERDGGSNNRVDVKEEFRITRGEIGLGPEAIQRVEHWAIGQPDLAAQQPAVA